ncbi:MAG TPA: GNAT family N-acetyltransferase [Thermoflexia bacterium]|nr:GNAT family N-acetyltransferase [Thermoflexia bacterium]
MKTPNDHEFIDSEGLHYDFIVDTDEEVYLDVSVSHNNFLGIAFVGEAKCLFRSQNTLELADIVIRDSAIIFRKSLWKLTPHSILLKFVNRDFRRRGIGSALLQFVISQARNSGIRMISARAISRDTPFEILLPWYAKQGFDIPALPYESLADGVWITMLLD